MFITALQKGFLSVASFHPLARATLTGGAGRTPLDTWVRLSKAGEEAEIWLNNHT